MSALSIFNRMSLHQKAWEKVLDASNRDEGVLKVRLGAIMKQMMLYRTPKLKIFLPAPPKSKQTL